MAVALDLTSDFGYGACTAPWLIAAATARLSSAVGTGRIRAWPADRHGRGTFVGTCEGQARDSTLLRQTDKLMAPA